MAPIFLEASRAGHATSCSFSSAVTTSSVLEGYTVISLGRGRITPMLYRAPEGPVMEVQWAQEITLLKLAIVSSNDLEVAIYIMSL